MIIEQAIFLSSSQSNSELAEDATALARCTAGLSPADAQELALLAQAGNFDCANRTAICFVQLASGDFAVGRTTCVAKNSSNSSSDQADACWMTWFLVVGHKGFVQAANNPFTLLELASLQGAMGTGVELPDTLTPLHLATRGPTVDTALLARLARQPGPEAMATLVQAALVSDRLAIATTQSAESLLGGMFSVLPIELRAQFTFATGRRTFVPQAQIAELPRTRDDWEAFARGGVTLLNLDEMREGEPEWQGWAGCVAEILRNGKLSLLRAQLELHRPWLNVTTLPLLAEQIDAELHASAPALGVFRAQHGRAERPVQRSDGAHPWHALAADGPRRVASSNLSELAAALNGQPPEVLELLERIDDLVFNAIGGDLNAQGELEVLWPMAAMELDENLVEQTREQYLRCALSIWTECVDRTTHDPKRAVSAIDVLCVLFSE